MATLLIQGGAVHDPANGVDGAVQDIWISGGRVIAPPAEPGARAERVLDARGYVVMPGAVDMHCHIVGPKVNVARKMRPEERRAAPAIPRTARTRSGTIGSVPSTFATGYLYAGLGYTTAVDAAIPPLFARHAHEEFSDTPLIDKAFLTLVGNNHYVMNQVRSGELDRLDGFLAWLLGAVKGFGLKAVNPGGIEEWKQNDRATLNQLDQPVGRFGVTPRQILRELAAANDRLGLPHPLHIHCNNLGMPGNWGTTLGTMESLEGQRGHLAHIQFHSYGGGPDDEFSFSSAVPKLVDYFNDHPNLTLDVGHVNFGATTSLTGDGPLGYYLHRVTGNKWFSNDTEMETGCGIVPIEYRDRNLIHGIQWAAGLEWYLLASDPWRVAMSTDHPNGGAFLRYPELVALLMSRALRQEVLATLPERVRQRTVLADLDREYSLNEIAIITRASPARILGLANKGHLGVGADGDVTILAPNDDRRKMFSLPRYVIKGGEIIVDDGDIRRQTFGKTLLVEPPFDAELKGDIRRWIEAYYTVQFENYAVEPRYVDQAEVIPTPRS